MGLVPLDFDSGAGRGPRAVLWTLCRPGALQAAECRRRCQRPRCGFLRPVAAFMFQSLSSLSCEHRVAGGADHRPRL